MRLAVTAAPCLIGILAAACHKPQPATPLAATHAERTIFTDSAMHAQQCEAQKPGEDWRSVCVPKDQSEAPRKKP